MLLHKKYGSDLFEPFTFEMVELKPNLKFQPQPTKHVD